MKAFTFLILLSTMSLSATQPPVTDRHEALLGFWYEPGKNTQLEIRYHYDGIKVREIERNRRKGWDVYRYMGRGLYDNYDGRIIKVTDYNEIRWKKGRKRSRYLVKDRNYNRSRYGRSYRSYPRYDECAPGSYRRDRYSSSYDQTYTGSWYCDDENLYLEIERYGDGIRARRPRRAWVYYDGDRRSGYRDRKGNRYFFDDNGYLCWQSRDTRRIHRFRRR